MYKSVQRDIKRYYLGSSLYQLHKESSVKSDFGMDNSQELIDGGFGLYSSANLKQKIGPVKTEYFRIGLVRSGKVNIDIGLETFQPVRNGIILGFPGQVFSLYDPDPDFLCYYMLFSEEFIDGSFRIHDSSDFPFFTYAGVQCFPLTEQHAAETESIILKINDEVKNMRKGTRRAIQLYIQLILLQAKRSYECCQSAPKEKGQTGNSLFREFIRLVSRHFLTNRKVSDYASLLNVSSDHLNRTIKSFSDKTAHELIDDMILREAKACLHHSAMSVAEVAYKLEFSDPSHFNKFFKKLTGQTPQQYRGRPS